ncbi:MAG: TetR family transcriptional regulator C-terminal domain-containing protein [Parvibaculaceae bacterium]
MSERVTATEKTGPRFARETPDVRRRLLIEAAIRCLAEGGIAAFTIDRISREANVSRGLINHHFDGIAGLLTAVYEDMTRSMYKERRDVLREGTAEERLLAIIDTMFRPPMFAKSNLRAWLALWGEVATNPAMKVAHRRSYDAYRGALKETLEEIAKARGMKVDAQGLATTCIALIDGLWIEWCLDATVINRESARAAVHDVIEARLGKVGR